MSTPTHPLSYPQRRLWFLEQLQPGLPVYNVPLGYRIRGPLNVAALRAALSALVDRHEVLRTAYRVVAGEPRQLVLPPRAVALPVVSDGDAAALAREPFDLAEGEVFRAALVRHGPEDHRLLLNLHHIACDAATVGVLCRDLSALYAGTPLPPLPARYTDFAAAQVARPVAEETLRYWRERLGGATPSGLPADLPRPTVQTFRGGQVTVPLPPDAVAALAALARWEGTTLFTALLAVFGVLVARCSGEDDVVVGVPVAVRDRPEYTGLAGFFANTLVLRLDLSGRPTFTELLRRCWAEVAAGITHADLPFERLVEELHPDRDLAHNPVFGVLFSLRDEDEVALVLPGCAVTEEHEDTDTAKFDLTLSLTRTGDEISARLEYCTDLYRPDTAERVAARFRTLLGSVAAHQDIPVAELDLLPPDERELLASWSRGPELSDVEDLTDLVARHAAAAPDEPALLAGDRTMTRGELLAAADAVAARLHADGIGRDTVVGVYLDRTPELLVAILGVLRAGAAYLPLDPAYPDERLAFMVRDSGCPLVLTRRGLARRARALPAPVLAVDDLPAGTAPSPVADPGRLAYVIYTSGSTGRPKGVQVTHRNLGAFGAGVDRLLGTEPGVWLALTSFSFDISVLELLWTLARGYRVVLQADRPAAGAPGKVPEFSLFYFGNESAGDGPRYRLLMEGARFADRTGFTAVWTPERHFHSFGGLYPNPSVTGAAVAAITERVAVRAGSVVAPLHDPLRVAEEWSVVDHLSGGRVGISFASGWHARDFALAPDRYDDRRSAMLRAIEEVRALWRGEPVHRRSGTGEDVELRVYPRPLQRSLPVWLTSAKSPETFRTAGEIGAGLLTHLLGHDVDQLAEKIALYRRSWRGEGEPHVTVMLHTFLGEDRDAVRARVRGPLSAYLRTSIDLLSNLGGLDRDIATLPDDELTALVDRAFDRFFSHAALLGTPEDAVAVVERLAAADVDEVACLVDFGVDEDAVLASLPLIAELRDLAEARHRAGAAWRPEAAVIREHGVTHLQCTPSLARALTDDPGAAAALATVGTLLVGGEALPQDLAARLATHPGPVHNMYGPTEATIWATSAPVDGTDVRIGRPLAGVRAHVVDRELRPAPIGVPGELLLGGPGVAAGYLGRPARTAERFITGPDGDRVYRTGDLVRWGPDGTLEFLGRLDHQVKLRGHRIELGEIEALLAEHAGVGQAVAAVRGEGAAATLAAWYTGTADPHALRAHLADRLPDYMVPARLTVLDRLPLTPNGKLDRAALPDGDTPVRAVFRPADSGLARTIADVWRTVLRLDRVGLDDNFFDLGGNSLLLLGVRTELLDRLPAPVSLVDMFRYPTIGTLAAALERTGPATADAASKAAELAGRRRAGLARHARARQGGRAHD
ncbi:MupA/Atu3671 family FMN-dependent luciferase-like monooxygenase [Actinophytocola sp. KF-1]